MNCVSKNEGHRELILGFQNLRIGGQTDRQTDRQMGRTKTPLQLEPVQLNGLGHSIFLAPRLRKEYRDTYTVILGNYGLFYFENYLSPARRVRRSLLQYIMYRTAVVVIAVLTAGSSGRTVFR